MPSAFVYDKKGKKIDTLDLNQKLFGQKPNPSVIHQYVRAYLANQRQGTAKRKSRSEVRGGGAKPWRQKGTGRARAGTNTSPIWVGGGRAFPPQMRDYRIDLPKKIKRMALISALSSKAQENRIKVLDNVSMDVPKTKTVADLLDKLKISRSKIIFLFEGMDENLYKSGRNIKGLVFKRASLINPYDLLNSDFLIMTKKALEKVEEVFAQ
ncbi:MAG: 50S ribosomal protein L4 [candidate division Zixibacteria bacterium SM1_73]|nr:MAG: 50S ribosomal protein L4 [candidate division Zixibacteria bacterium SM1_73]